MSRRLIPGIVTTLLAAAILALAIAQLNTSTAAQAGGDTLRVEVAENFTMAVFDAAPVFDDGFPAHGNAFMTQGYIYPAGTLINTNGVLPDGSPEFPDKVLGTWYCLGYNVGEAGYTENGVWVVGTEVYEFGEVPGNETLVTDGIELADQGVFWLRAITGGTGRFAGARGEVQKRTLGFNATEGVNFEAEIRVMD